MDKYPTHLPLSSGPGTQASVLSVTALSSACGSCSSHAPVCIKLMQQKGHTGLNVGSFYSTDGQMAFSDALLAKI